MKLRLRAGETLILPPNVHCVGTQGFRDSLCKTEPQPHGDVVLS